MTSNLPKLSNRAHKALDVLADGGSFRYGLERNSYTGREQFQWRLRTAGGHNVSGIGHAAANELKDAGFLDCGTPSGFTGMATIYKLNKGE